MDPEGYDPDDWRNRRDWQPYGEPRMTFENWRRDQAWHLFSRAQLEWQEEHGWPGGLDAIELLQDQVRNRRARLDG